MLQPEMLAGWTEFRAIIDAKYPGTISYNDGDRVLDIRTTSGSSGENWLVQQNLGSGIDDLGNLIGATLVLNWLSTSSGFR
jgi:hypothetical protein